jgi:serine/threonine protein kinase
MRRLLIDSLLIDARRFSVFRLLLLLQVTRAVKKELYLMKELAHDNVNRFIGACIDPGHLCIVTQYCSRGSLRVSGNSVMYARASDSEIVNGTCISSIYRPTFVNSVGSTSTRKL